MRRRLGISFVVLASVAGAVVVALVADRSDSDFAPFAAAGHTLLSAHFLHTYHDPFVQAGPFELVLCYLAKLVGGNGLGAAVVLDVTGVVVLLGVAYMTVARRARELAVVSAAAFALFVVRDLGSDAHPAELSIALLWFLAARDARRGRLVRAGVLVGLSAGFETWGVLGVTVLALAPSLRGSVRALLPAGVVAAAIYAPFMVGGDFHMFELHWKTAHGLAGTIFGLNHAYTWPMRVAEAAIVVSVGGLVALRLRRHRLSVWLVPAVTSVTRLFLDPVRYGYYWDTALTLLTLGVAPWALAPRVLARNLSVTLERRFAPARG